MLVEGGWTLPAAGQERGVRGQGSEGLNRRDPGRGLRILQQAPARDPHIDSGPRSSQDREPCFCPLVWPWPALRLMTDRNM